MESAASEKNGFQFHRLTQWAEGRGIGRVCFAVGIGFPFAPPASGKSSLKQGNGPHLHGANSRAQNEGEIRNETIAKLQ
jgi:hypothetical protein